MNICSEGSKLVVPSQFWVNWHLKPTFMHSLKMLTPNWGNVFSLCFSLRFFPETSWICQLFEENFRNIRCNLSQIFLITRCWKYQLSYFPKIKLVNCLEQYHVFQLKLFGDNKISLKNNPKWSRWQQWKTSLWKEIKKISDDKVTFWKEIQVTSFLVTFWNWESGPMLR